jgi:hypothetical protein
MTKDIRIFLLKLFFYILIGFDITGFFIIFIYGVYVNNPGVAFTPFFIFFGALLALALMSGMSDVIERE